MLSMLPAGPKCCSCARFPCPSPWRAKCESGLELLRAVGVDYPLVDDGSVASQVRELVPAGSMGLSNWWVSTSQLTEPLCRSDAAMPWRMWHERTVRINIAHLPRSLEGLTHRIPLA